MTPTKGKVIIRPQKEEENKHGIIVHKVVEDQPEQGEIVAVCEDSEFKKGQIAIFRKYAPDQIKVGDEELLVVHESDLLCLLT